MLQQLETQMREAAKKFEFERPPNSAIDRALKQKDVAGLFSSKSLRRTTEKLSGSSAG